MARAPRKVEFAMTQHAPLCASFHEEQHSIGLVDGDIREIVVDRGFLIEWAP